MHERGPAAVGLGDRGLVARGERARRAPRRPRRPGRAGAWRRAADPARVRSRTAPHSSARRRSDALHQCHGYATDRLGRDDDVVRIVPDVATERATAGHEHEPRRAGRGRTTGPRAPRPSATFSTVDDAVLVRAAVGTRHRHRGADADVPQPRELPDAGRARLSTWAATTVEPAGSAGAGPNWYQPARSASSGICISPSSLDPDRVARSCRSRRRARRAARAAGVAPRPGGAEGGVVRRATDGDGAGSRSWRRRGGGDATTDRSGAGSGPVQRAPDERRLRTSGASDAGRGPGRARSPSRASAYRSCAGSAPRGGGATTGEPGADETGDDQATEREGPARASRCRRRARPRRRSRRTGCRADRRWSARRARGWRAPRSRCPTRRRSCWCPRRPARRPGRGARGRRAGGGDAGRDRARRAGSAPSRSGW